MRSLRITSRDDPKEARNVHGGTGAGAVRVLSVPPIVLVTVLHLRFKESTKGHFR